MKYGRFVYFLIVVFVSITLLTVYMQYNSSRNIKGLISGNERLLEEFSNDKDLRNIQSHILNIESKVRGMIVTGDTAHKEGIEDEISKIDVTMNRLQHISDSSGTEQLVDRLDSLLKLKIGFERETLVTYLVSGKQAAEKMNTPRKVKELTDNISNTIQQLETVRRETLAGITVRLDRSGRKAYLWGYIFLAFVLLTTITGFLFIVNKIKQQQELIMELDASEKRVREAARIKENFMANMSHEIRTPMNAILGFTNLLQRQPIDEKAKDYVRSIQTSGENLLAIVNDILDLSKIEAGMMRIEESAFSVRGLIHSVEAMFRNKVQERGLALSTYIDEKVPDILIGDNIRLTQVFVNLVGNAVKFTSKGSIEIYISGAEGEKGVFNFLAEIRDTGIGISGDKIQNIFERFRQGENSTTRKYGGTGLGLSIVKELVTIQKGIVEVQSEPGKGSVFSFMIPYHISADQYAFRKQEQEPDIKEWPDKDIRILIAEDNEINQKLLIHLFEEWGITYAIASNGLEAIDKLKKELFDLVLMDIQMPQMDGYTTTSVIRKELKMDIPVVAMTAHAMAGEREKCISYGMNEHLPKPVREADLLSVISKFVKKDFLNPVSRITQHQDTTPVFSVIDLDYMKQISNGNRDYEKTVTEQFIEMTPEAVETIKQAFLKGSYDLLRDTAHNLKTTVSVMGLGTRLDPLLDQLEHAAPGHPGIESAISEVSAICEAAVKEASVFYGSL